MNFRATRRDLLVYHDLGDVVTTDPGIAQRFERQNEALRQAKEKQDLAVAQGKHSQDFGLESDGPFGAVRRAKGEFATILEDFARRTASYNQNFHVLSLAEVRLGMTAADGIVMYFRPEPRFRAFPARDAAGPCRRPPPSVAATAGVRRGMRAGRRASAPASRWFGILLVRRRQHRRRHLRMSRIVITGAPGAGKTTLLLALQARGYTIVGDTARTIIQDRRRRGLSPRPDPYAFAQEALRMDIENFVHHAASPGPVFFDRGVLDALCGLDHITPLNESELSMWLSKYRYFPKVFVLPPWKAIYENDAERDHTFEHAQSVNRIAQEWYRRCGYQVLEVPMVSVDERCTFVLQALANSDA